MKKILNVCMLYLFVAGLHAQEAVETGYLLRENVSYVSGDEKDAYRQERCKLDIYYPAGGTDAPVVVWFHGGGLEGGEKSIPDELKNKGLVVVAPNYRLSPRAQHPAYIVDAAEAVAWVYGNIAEYGGSPQRIYVSGHSAGGYLTLMVGMDKSYLAAYGLDADRIIKGLAPVSGQTNTHYTIRKERGLRMEVPLIDTYAPLNHVRSKMVPTWLITGCRNLEMTARYEENAHLYAVLRAFGNDRTELFELDGFDHGNVYAPACYLIVDFVRKIEGESNY